MVTSTAWAIPSPAEKYGGSLASAQTAQTRDATALKDVAAPAAPGPGGIWSPREPLFWFLAIAATSLGLAAYSTTVRVGASEISLDVGKTGGGGGS